MVFAALSIHYSVRPSTGATSMPMTLFGQALCPPFAALAARLASWAPATERTQLAFRPLWAARHAGGGLSPGFCVRLAEHASHRWAGESGMLLGAEGFAVVTDRIDTARPVRVFERLALSTALAARTGGACTLRHEVHTAQGALVAVMESHLLLADGTGWADLQRSVPSPPPLHAAARETPRRQAA